MDKTSITLTCHHCGNIWEYAGIYINNPKALISCPACGGKVRIEKAGEG